MRQTVLLIALLGILVGLSLAGEADKQPGTLSALKLKVVTYNVERAKQPVKLIKVLRKANADVLCLQEVPGGGIFGIREIARSLRMNFEYQYYGHKKHMGCAILSRGKIGRSEPLVLAGERNFGLVSTVQIGKAKIKVLCIHLKSLPRPILTGLFLSSAARAKQARIIADMVKKELLPVIVAGDCNTLAIMREYTTLQKVLTDACAAAGTSTQPSILISGAGYRIDHVFFKGPWRVRSCQVIQAKASDHMPVAADLVLTNLPATAGTTITRSVIEIPPAVQKPQE